MKQFFATVFVGAFLALATAMMVLLFWLMMVVFGSLYLLTLPLHLLWRALREPP